MSTHQPRYQKHSRNATLQSAHSLIRPRRQVCWLGALLLSLCCYTLAPQPLLATSLPQSATETPRHLFLLPVEGTSISLQTHTADLYLNDDATSVTLDALYRLKNPGTTALTVLIRLTPDAAEGSLPDNVALAVADQPLTLTAVENGGYSAQVQIEADGRAELHLTYTLSLGDRPLPAVQYAANLLRQWQGDGSVRVAIYLPATVETASWLGVDPADWRYAQSAADQPVAIQWLYDGGPPEQPFRFQFVRPELWQQVQQAQQATTPDAAPVAYATLGDLYRKLYGAATTQSTLRDRFYGQALAAYTGGLDRASVLAAPASDAAALQAGLAALYRSRVIGEDGKLNATYAGLMDVAANAALSGLPLDDPRRRELATWRAEGLQAQLSTARSRRAWPSALAVIAQLSTLPSDIVDPTDLANMQRDMLAQQALQFLEQGNRAAALAVAGAEIADPSLLAPADELPLFARWQLSVTVTPDDLALVALVTAAPGRAEEARTQLENQALQWQPAVTANKGMLTIQPTLGLTESFDLALTLPGSSTGTRLVNDLPNTADWALLRTLLGQIAPAVAQSTGLLQQQVKLSQPIDLRTAGDQWGAMAATLERQASQFEAQAANTGNGDASSKSTDALRARVQAANYRNAAQSWQNLARDSWAQITLAAPIGAQHYTRSWSVTVVTPPQTLILQAQGLSPARLLVAALGVLLGLFVLTGLLWWLL